MPPNTVRAKFKAPPDAQPAPAAQQQPAAAGDLAVTDGIGDKLVPIVEVSIDGSPISAALVDAMHSVEVQQSLSLVDMAILTFDNPHGTIGDADVLSCGKEVEIKLGYLGAPVSLFTGDIVGIEPVYPSEGNPLVRIRAYDRSHRLRRGRKQRAFLEQKVSDIC